MDIEFDPAKDAVNRDKHGVSLGFGANIFGDVEHIVFPTTRIEDGEVRYRVVGMVAGRLWTAVFVYRDAGIRFISVRKSNDGERKTYDRDSG